MNKKLLVHISDIHITSETSIDDLKQNQICQSLGNYRAFSDQLIFLITGDIAQSGKKEEYEIAYIFFQEIKENLIKKFNFKNIDFCFCPGNHDLDFSKENEIRNILLESNINEKIKSDAAINEISKPQDNFFDFLNEIQNKNLKGLERISWKESFEHDNGLINIYSCNTSITSQRKERQGSLALFTPSYFAPKAEDLSITLIHHPAHWGSNENYKNFRKHIQKNSDFLFSGHEHDFDSFTINGDNFSCIIVESGVYHAAYEHTSSFNIIYIEGKKFDQIELKFDKNLNAFKAERDLNQRNLISINKTINSIISDDFYEFLNDAGADFLHPRKENLKLDDTFIWPEFRTENQNNITIYKQDAKKIIETCYKHKVIIGSELSGKTSLAKKIFSHRLATGKNPIYIDCKTDYLSGNFSKDITTAIKKSYGNNYEKISIKDVNEKTIIIDNFDYLAKRNSIAIGEFIEFSKHCAGEVLILTSKSLEELSLIDNAKFQSIGDFDIYSILEFGPTKRYDLIKKWISIGSDDNSTQEHDQHFDALEKDLQTAVGKKLIPSHPIFLLTLIQASESRSAPDLKGSAFGHYYHYLITTSLGKAEINIQQFDEYFNFCSIFAYKTINSASKEINESDFLDLVRDYSSSYTKISASKRISDLKRSNIIIEYTNNQEIIYKFKYPYLYYFFLGKYISDNLTDEAERVKHLSKNLHMSDNANILLFLSHFTKDKLVYESILNEIINCFEDYNEFDIVTGATVINDIIKEIKLENSEISISDDRDLRRDLRAMEENDCIETKINITPAPASQESINDLDDIDITASDITNWSSKVNKLFRSVEIMGQFIKNHYGSTRNDMKNRIIEELSSATLRGLNSFIIKCSENSISIPLLVEKIIENDLNDLTKEQKNIKIKQASFNVIGMISYAFINKVASALASEYIVENLDQVAKHKINNSYKVIDLAQNFELPKKLSFEKVEDLTKIFEKNVFATSMVRTLAYRHLHLYKIDYKERQKLCEKLNISIKTQRIAANKKI